ncbi:MAG: relaxase/mobilization nuclease domain-containing protein, partial [Ruminococcus sp.]|nr:relaxase/mobilization nuclease domain-containing protein [Ruminococcus sp.]
MIQSFAPNEVTPEQALQIGEELCDRFLKGDYQYVLAVHTDHDHIHCHIIFNNTNLYNGLSFTTEHNQGKVSERSWAQLRAISDELCRENGLSIIEPKGKGVSHFERDMQLQGKSWKDKLRAKIAEVAFYSKDFADFLQNCTASGIEYVYKPSNKVKLKFRLSGEGQ